MASSRWRRNAIFFHAISALRELPRHHRHLAPAAARVLSPDSLPSRRSALRFATTMLARATCGKGRGASAFACLAGSAVLAGCKPSSAGSIVSCCGSIVSSCGPISPRCGSIASFRADRPECRRSTSCTFFVRARSFAMKPSTAGMDARTPATKFPAGSMQTRSTGRQRCVARQPPSRPRTVSGRSPGHRRPAAGRGGSCGWPRVARAGRGDCPGCAPRFTEPAPPSSSCARNGGRGRRGCRRAHRWRGCGAWRTGRRAARRRRLRCRR